MTFEQIATNLDEFEVHGPRLSRQGKEISCFDTPIRELARLGEQLFIIVEPRRSDENGDYAGTNLFSINLAGKVIWKAPNLNIETGKPGWHYFKLRIFDAEAPKIHVMVDDRAWRYFDALTGSPLSIQKNYDWKNYPIARKQFLEDMNTLDQTIISQTQSFYSDNLHRLNVDGT